jgi:HK97 family phage portal protein
LPNGDLAYRTSDGETGGRTRIIAAKDMLHPRLTSWDGILGMSPVTMARHALGLDQGAEKFGSRLFANSAVPSVVLTSPNKYKPEDKIKMRADFEALQTGHNQHRTAILDDGLSLLKLSLTAEESQFLETRKFSRAQIASIFRIPAHMVGELGKMSNSNTEQMSISFVTDTLQGYMSRLQAEITRKLLPREIGKPSNIEVLFDVTQRLKGDTTAQAAWATAGRNGGWLTANDVRRSFGLNEGPSPELDQYISPVNYVNSERLLDAPKLPTELEGTNV